MKTGRKYQKFRSDLAAYIYLHSMSVYGENYQKEWKKDLEAEENV